MTITDNDLLAAIVAAEMAEDFDPAIHVTGRVLASTLNCSHDKAQRILAAWEKEGKCVRVKVRTAQGRLVEAWKKVK